MSKKIIKTSVLVAIVVSVFVSIVSITSFVIPNNEYVYIPSNITKANPNLMVLPAEFSMGTCDISETKHTVVLTLSGTVTSVGDPIIWEYENQTYGAVPVTIDVSKKTKDKETELVLNNGDLFTFYLAGAYERGEHYILGFEPQFELGEKVIVHLGKDDQGHKGENGNNYFVVLGLYGKYRVVDNKGYNEKYDQGRSLDLIFKESL